MENFKYITTLEELQKYIGKVVYMYYTIDGTKNGKIQYAWAKKITDIKLSPFHTNLENNETIRKLEIYGTDCVVFEDCFPLNRIPSKRHIPRFDYKEDIMSNAQQYIRELTITEKLFYRMLVKKEERK